MSGPDDTLRRLRLALGRRGLLMLSASALAACASPAQQASAQQQRRPPPPRPRPPPGRPSRPTMERLPPVPQPRGPDDVGGILLTGTGAPAGTEFMITYAFPPGALPQGAGLVARLVPGDRPLPTQFQPTTRHPDGSARIGLVTLAAPALPEGQHVGVLLARARA